MQGGKGDDVYWVDNIGDDITEWTSDDGIDLVRSLIDYTLGFQLENLYLVGDHHLSGTGNELAFGNEVDGWQFDADSPTKLLTCKRYVASELQNPRDFELHPDMAEGGEDYVAYLAAKYGTTAEQVAANRDRLGTTLLETVSEPGGPLALGTLAVGLGATLYTPGTRPDYARLLSERYGPELDFARRPVEDFASMMVEFETSDGQTVIGEATTSWSYVGAGLRLSAELLGPEYSMSWRSIDSGLNVFFSREVRGEAGEDLVEKQNAEQGLMPVLEDEAGVYGYTDENRHMVECFRKGEVPLETFEDGLAVVEILMALYRSAEIGETVHFPAPDLEDYVPPVARRKA